MSIPTPRAPGPSRTCNGCGAPLAEGTRFCTACGAASATPAAPSSGDGFEWRKWAPFLAGAGAVVVAVVVAGLLLGGGGRSNSGARSTSASFEAEPTTAETEGAEGSAAAPATTSSGVESVEPAGTAPASGETAQASRLAVVAVLGEYEAAYAAADLASMAALLTVEVERHGLTAKGCSTAFGKPEVLDAYRGQFAVNGPVPYRLVGLRSADVVLEGPTMAHVRTTYSIPSTRNSGSIAFTLELRGEAWRISAIDATCHAGR